MQVNEITCRSALVKSGIPGVSFVLNPYTGCAHACVYCYASFMMRFRPHASPWGRFVDVKTGFPGRLKRESSRPLSGEIMLSSVTDPYQPVEATYRLTRACLEILAGAQDRQQWLDEPGAEPSFTVSVLTKSDLVTRDTDILAGMRAVEVGMTVTSPDDAVSAMFEPGAPPASKRFAALESLARAGIRTWAFVGPVIPYYSDRVEPLTTLFKRLLEAGVKKVLVDRMNLYPACLSGVLRACRKNQAAVKNVLWARDDPGAYEDMLKGMIGEAQAATGCPVEIVF